MKILSAAIRHSSGGCNPEGRTNKLATGFRRYDVKIFTETEPLILGEIVFWEKLPVKENFVACFKTQLSNNCLKW
jgi:hypothetical protein